jgi:hypothetical protein
MEEQKLVGRDPCGGNIGLVPVRRGGVQRSNAPLPHCTAWDASALHLVDRCASL